jgi:hypothetical protein
MLVIWATVSVALVALLYPNRAFYEWSNESNRWERMSQRDAGQYRYDTRRTFVWDIDSRTMRWGESRHKEEPNILRAFSEAAAVLTMGIGLAFILKTSGPAS